MSLTEFVATLGLGWPATKYLTSLAEFTASYLGNRVLDAVSNSVIKGKKLEAKDYVILLDTRLRSEMDELLATNTTLDKNLASVLRSLKETKGDSIPFSKVLQGQTEIKQTLDRRFNNVDEQLKTVIKNQSANKSTPQKSIILPNRPEPKPHPSNVLFTTYSFKCENYYAERAVDRLFLATVNLTNVWIYGGSGVGKTTLVMRNLELNNTKYLFCDMSMITIGAIADVFDEIFWRLSDKFDVTPNEKGGTFRRLAQALLRCERAERFVVVIDELSISDRGLHEKFIEAMVTLINFYSNQSRHKNLVFVVSTIMTPINFKTDSKKRSQYFDCLNCNDWSADMAHLFELLKKGLGMNVSQANADLILANSKSRPRLLKEIVRKLYTALKARHKPSVQEVINECLQEQVSND
ncbi:MAG: ATP-binding protein [Nitrosomonadaceae bacterium]